MANFYYDCEFLEGKQDKRFLGIKYGETKNTIDLISIGIVSEDSQEYYAISKDFNLREAWNRYDLVWEQTYGDMRNQFPEGRYKKVYWIRENVLKPIFEEFLNPIMDSKDNNYRTFNFKNFKILISKYGKTNKQIAEDVFNFCSGDTLSIEKAKHYNVKYENINLYGYYSAYDHICFAWLFGKMIDLPNGFPMLTYDLKQIMDEKVYIALEKENKRQKFLEGKLYTFNEGLDLFKTRKDYPKQQNEHSSIFDARWNKQLHDFLKTTRI